MKRSALPPLILVLGFALGGAVGFLVGRRAVGVQWFELSVVLLLALGWLGTAIALRRRLEDLLDTRLATLTRLAFRLARPATSLASPSAIPGESHPPGPVPPPGDPLGSNAEPQGSPIGADQALSDESQPPAALPWEQLSTEPSDDQIRSADEQPTSQAPLVPPAVEALIAAWQAYLERGDGRFTPIGLQRCLDEAGIAARVVPPEVAPLGPDVLAVEDQVTGQVYLLPNFNATVRALEAWFQPAGPRSLTARVQRLLRPAQLRRAGGELTLAEPGAIE
jgi:hypothetical protein